MQNENVLPPLPLTLNTVAAVVVEPFRAPGEIVDPAEGEHLEQVDVGGGVVDVGKDGGDHLHVFFEAEGPKDGQGMPNDDEDDECSEVDKRYDKIFLADPHVDLTCDSDRVDDKQDDDNDAIDAQDGGGDIVQFFKFIIIIVDQYAIE